MFSKIVAISTVKHLSGNYASFSNPVCKSGIAYPLLIGLKASWKYYPSTADFHGDGYFLQNAGFTKGLRIAFVVCDVNSKYRHIQVNSVEFIGIYKNTPIIQNAVFDIPLQNHTASHTLSATETAQFFISMHRLIYLVLFRYTLKADGTCQALFLEIAENLMAYTKKSAS